jgi:integrating conjugative element protein (TIGR03765 family)
MEKSTVATGSKLNGPFGLMALVVFTSLAVPVVHGSVPAPGVVVFDSGSASEISNWVDSDMFETIEGQLNVEQMQQMVKAGLESLDPTQAKVPQVFPISPQLIKSNPLPGTQIIKKIPDLPQPLFVIGNDDYSLRWFKANKHELMRYGAMGILTTAKNQTEWEFMQELVAPLKLFPMNADVLVDQLGLPGYPVLITKGGFFQ